ncbi:MAG: OmpA family protein [Longimicrobiales bacterium]
MRVERRVGVVFAPLMLVMAACGSNPEPEEPAPQPMNEETTEFVERPLEPTTEVAEDPAAAERAARRNAIEEMVFFDYDRSEIRLDAAEILSRKLPILREDPTTRARIEGHADERGSVEYNLALGMRRAEAVKNYLVGFGLDASRFDTNTLGEDRPLDPGKTEEAYARNRRAEFVITAGSLLER